MPPPEEPHPDESTWVLDPDHVVDVTDYDEGQDPAGGQGRGVLETPPTPPCTELNDTVAAPGDPLYYCIVYEVRCQSLPPIQVTLAERAADVPNPLTDTKGMLVLFSGSGGDGWWAFLDTLVPTSDAAVFLNDLNADGYQIAIAKWSYPWMYRPTRTGTWTSRGSMWCRAGRRS